MNSKSFRVLQRTFLKYDWVIILLLGGVFYLIHSQAFPLQPGRDFGTYFLYYKGLFERVPEYPYIMLLRTPATSLYYGLQLDLGGIQLLRITTFFEYQILIYLLYQMGKNASWVVGLATVVLVGMNPTFFSTFHSVASESLTSFALVLWVFFTMKTFASAKYWVWVFQAFLVFLLIMIRPGHQVLGIICLLPLLPGTKLKAGWGRRVLLSLVFLFSLLSFTQAYKTYNYLRYGVSKIAVGGPAHMPFFRTFYFEKLVKPENGPYSKALDEMIRTDLLTRKPYVDYGVDADLFYKASSLRSFYGIVDVLHQRDGYYSDTPLLTKVAIEAHNTYPVEFWTSYLDSLIGVFGIPPIVVFRPERPPEEHFDLEDYYRKVEARGLPIPSEGDIIPSYFSYVLIQDNDSNAVEDVEGRSFHAVADWSWRKDPPKSWAVKIVHLFGVLQPKVCILLFLGCCGYVFSKCRKDWLLFYLSLSLAGTLCVSLMGLPYVLYRYPFDPLIILFSLTGAFYLFSDLWAFVSNVKPGAIKTS